MDIDPDQPTSTEELPGDAADSTAQPAETAAGLAPEEAGAPEAGIPGGDLPKGVAAMADSGGGLDGINSDEASFGPPMPGHNAAQADPQMVAFFVTDQRLRRLWERADYARIAISGRVNNLLVGDALLDQIRYARNSLLAGRQFYDDAERHVNEVEYRLAFSRRVARWSDRLGITLFAYELMWGIVLLVILFFGLGSRAFERQTATSDLIYLASSMLWGGLGGVIGALYALVKHVTIEQDFDKQYRLWYYNSPLMGLGVGVVVYAVLRAGLLSIAGPSQVIESPFIFYLLAWLAGYQHNIFTQIVKRLLQVFKLDDGSSETTMEKETIKQLPELPGPTRPTEPPTQP